QVSSEGLVAARCGNYQGRREWQTIFLGPGYTDVGSGGWQAHPRLPGLPVRCLVQRARSPDTAWSTGVLAGVEGPGRALDRGSLGQCAAPVSDQREGTNEWQSNETHKSDFTNWAPSSR